MKFVDKYTLSQDPKDAVECLDEKLNQTDYYAGQLEELEIKVQNLIEFNKILFKKLLEDNRFKSSELAEYFYKDLISDEEEYDI